MKFKWWLILNIGLILVNIYGIFYVKAPSYTRDFIGNVIFTISIIFSLFVIYLIYVTNKHNEKL